MKIYYNKNYKVLLEKHLRKMSKKVCLCTKKFSVKMATLIGFKIVWKKVETYSQIHMQSKLYKIGKRLGKR